jgi:hypothetical protein
MDNTFHTSVKEFCKSKTWKWEPQAPQMPHLNNLDVAVFPMMSKHQSALLQNYLIVQAPTDEIWRTAEQVWMDLGSAEIARGFILAYRIAKKVIDCRGKKTFLQKQEFHSAQGSRRLLRYAVRRVKEDQSRRLTLVHVLQTMLLVFRHCWIWHKHRNFES